MNLRDLEEGLESANKELYIEKLESFVHLSRQQKTKTINEQKKN